MSTHQLSSSSSTPSMSSSQSSSTQSSSSSTSSSSSSSSSSSQSSMGARIYRILMPDQNGSLSAILNQELFGNFVEAPPTTTHSIEPENPIEPESPIEAEHPIEPDPEDPRESTRRELSFNSLFELQNRTRHEKIFINRRRYDPKTQDNEQGTNTRPLKPRIQIFQVGASMEVLNLSRNS
jgi:hypothetical protein